MPAAPRPPSQNERYWKPTLTSLRRPGLGDRARRRSRRRGGRPRSTCDVVARRSIWLGRSPSTASKASRATPTTSGCATQVPSKPSAGLALLVGAHGVDRRARWPRGRVRDGISAAMPPIAKAPRRWQVATSSSRVGAHERDGHLHVVAVGQHELGPVAEELDHREDVVPAAGVEPVGVLAQLEEDLLHLERGGQRLDQDRGADRARAASAERLLRPGEDVVPEPRLEVVLELGQVEVGRRAAREQARGAVEGEQAEVEERPRERLAVERRCFSCRCQPRGRTSSVATSSPSA